MVVLLGEAGGGNAFVPDIASASFPPPARTVIGRISNYNGSTRTRRDARHDCSIGGHRAGRSQSAKRFSLSARVCMRARTRTVDCSPRSEPIRTPNVHVRQPSASSVVSASKSASSYYRTTPSDAVKYVNCGIKGSLCEGAFFDDSMLAIGEIEIR